MLFQLVSKLLLLHRLFQLETSSSPILEPLFFSRLSLLTIRLIFPPFVATRLSLEQGIHLTVHPLCTCLFLENLMNHLPCKSGLKTSFEFFLHFMNKAWGPSYGSWVMTLLQLGAAVDQHLCSHLSVLACVPGLLQLHTEHSFHSVLMLSLNFLSYHLKLIIHASILHDYP